MSKGAKIAIFLAALALAAAIAACVLLITGRKDHPAETEAPQTEATEATDGTTETVADKTLEAGEEVTTTYGKAANLIDADNFGKNAATDNASYTTSTAEAGDVQMRTVVARDATGYCLTNADLQIYYWMEFYQLMNNYGLLCLHAWPGLHEDAGPAGCPERQDVGAVFPDERHEQLRRDPRPVSGGAGGGL